MSGQAGHVTQRLRKNDLNQLKALGSSLRWNDIWKEYPKSQNWIPAYAGMTAHGAIGMLAGCEGNESNSREIASAGEIRLAMTLGGRSCLMR